MKIAIDINGIFVPSGIAHYVKLLVKSLALIDRENEYLFYSHCLKNLPKADISKIESGKKISLWKHYCNYVDC